MTAKKIYERALLLLGYSDKNDEGYFDSALLKKGLAAINQIYTDLYYIIGNRDFCEIYSIEDKIDLPIRLQRDVMPYGVAMLLAQCEGDGDEQRLFAGLYAKKRQAIRKENGIKDVLHRGGGL